MSMMRQPAGTLSTSTTWLCASASNLSAMTASTGSTSLSPACAMMALAVSTEPSSTRLSAIS